MNDQQITTKQTYIQKDNKTEYLNFASNKPSQREAKNKTANQMRPNG